MMWGKVTSDEHINVIERYCKGDVLRVIPTGSLCRERPIGGRSVDGEISNMLNISWQSPHRPAMAVTRQSVAQSPNK